MVSPEVAISILDNYNFQAKKERIGIGNALNRILAEEIKSNADFPSYEQVSSDGIALVYNSFKKGWRDFKIEGVQPARMPRLTLKDSRNCIEVATGAMVPIGCDSVVPASDVSISYANRIARVNVENIRAGQHINSKASSVKKGDTLLNAGVKLSALEISLIATSERSEIDVFVGPKACILSIGSDFVDINAFAHPHQIRLAESYGLLATLKSLNCDCSQFHFPDDPNILDSKLSDVIHNHDLVIIIVGISKGKSDTILEALTQLGVKTLFDGIEQLPQGRMVYGIKKNTSIFILPSQPIVTLLYFYKYVFPWLSKSTGGIPQTPQAILTKSIGIQTKLVSYLRVSLREEGGKLLATPTPVPNSNDFAHLKPFEGFLEIPPTDKELIAGSTFPLIRIKYN